jgi:hypothetical protein
VVAVKGGSPLENNESERFHRSLGFMFDGFLMCHVEEEQISGKGGKTLDEKSSTPSEGQ